MEAATLGRAVLGGQGVETPAEAQVGHQLPQPEVAEGRRPGARQTAGVDPRSPFRDGARLRRRGGPRCPGEGHARPWRCARPAGRRGATRPSGPIRPRTARPRPGHARPTHGTANPGRGSPRAARGGPCRRRRSRRPARWPRRIRRRRCAGHLRSRPHGSGGRSRSRTWSERTVELAQRREASGGVEQGRGPEGGDGQGSAAHGGRSDYRHSCLG